MYPHIIHAIRASGPQKITNGNTSPRKAGAGLLSLLPFGPAAAGFLKMLMIAGIWLGVSMPSAAFDMTGWECTGITGSTGSCGTLGSDGVVPLAPQVEGMEPPTTYGWISSRNGLNNIVPQSIRDNIGASSNGANGTTNATIIKSPTFSSKNGEKLSFYFNYITSDGAGFADYGWVRLLDGAGNQVAIFFTARTTTSGNTVPGYGMPLINGAVLTPSSTPIKSGGPKWSPLGGSSGTCYSTGCGYTGWIKMEYDVPVAGTYQLELGVANWTDTAYDTGLAFDGFMIGNRPITPDCISDKFVPPTLASNSNQISTDTVVYQAIYDTTNWTGHLYAYPYAEDADGYVNLSLTPKWDAAAKLPAYPNRKIYTWRPSHKAGSLFAWSGIDPEQQAMLRINNYFETPIADYYDGQKMINYIAGDRSNESPNGDKYRNRINLLGDIIGSSPVYVAGPNLTYPDSLESVSYNTFKSSNASRTPMIYVGANDGMLHAFRASDGVEQFAYVPSAVFPRLPDLASISYGHQFYVDGTPLVADAFFGSNWHTVLVGGLSAGGQGIYALDVTKPGSFTESSVLWEFGDRQTATASPANGKTNFDADLGYTYGTPYIDRVRSGSTTRWVAIFGNGYKNTEPDGSASTTGNAVLYVVDLQNGNLVRKLDTGKGKNQDPSGGGAPNGLMSPTPVDTNGDGNVDYVYAGDLHGNMWKFDLTSENSSNWKVAFNGAPLFTATGPNGAQPITVAPEVGRGPKGGTVIVYFGTGKIFETQDNTVESINSFYAVWDDMNSAVAAPGRSKLAQQTLTEVTANGQTWRTIANNNPVQWNTQRGWFLDLTINSAQTTEKSVSSPQLYDGRIVFTSVAPSASGDGCNVDGVSWLMELDALTGGALDGSPFDVNGDGHINSADLISAGGNGKYVVVGQKIQGLASAPLILTRRGGQPGDIVVNTSDAAEGNAGEGMDIVKTSGIGGQRLNWRDLSISQ